MSELLNCPFCGREARAETSFGKTHYSCNTYNCDASTLSMTKEEWNTRTTQPEVEAVIDAAMVVANQWVNYRDNRRTDGDFTEGEIPAENLVNALAKLDKEDKTMSKFDGGK